MDSFEFDYKFCDGEVRRMRINESGVTERKSPKTGEWQLWSNNDDVAQTAFRALLREAEADTAPDVSDADGWYKKFTSWFGVNEYNKICHLLALKERPDCITEVAEYVFENAFSEYIAALRAARKREGEAVKKLQNICGEQGHRERCEENESGEFVPVDTGFCVRCGIAFLATRETAALNEGANNGV